MNNLLKISFLFCCGLFIQFSTLEAQPITWQSLEIGLDFAEVAAPKKSAYDDSRITLLRIDPAHFSFHLINAKETKEENRTAQSWVNDKNLTAAINAGMYQTDHKTNVGYMKNFDFVNSSYVNKNNAVVAFNPKDPALPPFQIIDRQCQDWSTLKDQYHTLIQGIRMIDCNQKNRWSQQPKQWSMVVIGKDKVGRALFIFSRSPYSVHDFINMLRQLPIDLYNAMYLEGGPEASFSLNHPNKQVHKWGSYETGFVENNNNDRPWPIPNLIGIRPKQ